MNVMLRSRVLQCFSTKQIVLFTERLKLRGTFCSSSDGDKTQKEAGIEDLRQAMEAASEKTQKKPFSSDFPIKSPLLKDEASPNAQVLRNQFLREVLKKTHSVKKAKDTDTIDQISAEKDHMKADADTGFAELGGFKTELVTGSFDEQPMRLHPTRMFNPSDVYEPEELHPLGASRTDGRPRRRVRREVQVYPDEDIKRKLDFKNLMLMNNYLSDAGLILPRRITRLHKRLQKQLVKSVKLAQALALLPVLDRRTEFKRRPRRIQARDIFR